MGTTAFYEMDPDEVLDFSVDWSEWLATGDSISTAAWSAGDGVTIDSSSVAGAVATVWLSAPDVGERHVVTCHVVTAQGREGEQSITVYGRHA